MGVCSPFFPKPVWIFFCEVAKSIIESSLLLMYNTGGCLHPRGTFSPCLLLPYLLYSLSLSYPTLYLLSLSLVPPESGLGDDVRLVMLPSYSVWTLVWVNLVRGCPPPPPRPASQSPLSQIPCFASRELGSASLPWSQSPLETTASRY